MQCLSLPLEGGGDVVDGGLIFRGGDVVDGGLIFRGGDEVDGGLIFRGGNEVDGGLIFRGGDVVDVGFRKVNCMYIKYNKDLKDHATSLRKDMTKQEKHLWYDFLKSYPVRINRQKMLENFIVDFYCHKAKLVIELDGSQHYEEENIIYDKERTLILEQHNLKVIRFSNLDIDKNFDEVCSVIHHEIQERLKIN